MTGIGYKPYFNAEEIKPSVILIMNEIPEFYNENNEINKILKIFDSIEQSLDQNITKTSKSLNDDHKAYMDDVHLNDHSLINGIYLQDSISKSMS